MEILAALPKKSTWLPDEYKKKKGIRLPDLEAMFKTDGEGKRRANLIVIGKDGSGKSSLVARFTSQNWMEEMDPTLEAEYTRVVKFKEGIEIEYVVTDTVDQLERANSLDACADQFFCNIIVLDVASQESFDWASKKASSSTYKDATSILVGTRTDDKARTVPLKACTALAKEAGLPYIETSAKTGAGVEDAFVLALQQHLVKKGLIGRR
mmetsp:Transcript_20497/g.51903  ORF Transcript_20497/g.51903 Transcript_20497/m.51903 type:complete len:210 (+) Transcript_20497:123-752(+)|eukprot:CAMPEP_0177634608 /NCGR_PEP_ID=MMETSP0447-20121125/3458_1 /TAXON_ID=0 /ORGANISM="Stygamoeba regulata, Strain BSH-02190019" /LENGTH=209 /DNA_ID=CAMNT_0019136339 /DNA_START=209 /DNA_END=838 /DNA_ORIENTATION=-